MNKVVSKLLGGLFLTSLVAGLGLSISNSQQSPVESFAIGNYSTDANTYYDGITATSGKQLAAQLHDLITSTHQYYSSYDDNGQNGFQKETDRYYENGVAQKGYIYEFYSGVKWSDTWNATAGSTNGGYNREHCWCQSNSVNSSGKQMWGTTGGGSDMHHIRPVESRLNSTRNNHPYGVVSNRDSKKSYAKYGTNEYYAHGGYTDNDADVFEPLDSKKGDVARIILYTYLHYNSYTISDLFGSYGNTNGNGNSGFFSSSLLSVTKIMKPSTEAKALEMLLEWNNADPVDDIETRRNERVAKYQGNRNPFIDNSNYANLIWGSGTTPTNPTVNSVSVSPAELNLDVNGTTAGTLTATVSVSNDAPQTVTWTSSNTKVATVSNDGVVTAVAKGTCTVTATSTYNTNKSASCTVKVADTSGSGTVVTIDVTASTTIADYATAHSWVNGTQYTSIALDPVATAAVGTGGGNTGKYYTSGNNWRFYQNESPTIVISVADGYCLKSVTFSYVIENNGQFLDADSKVVNSGEEVSLSGQSATFSISGTGTKGQIRFTAILVTYSYDTVVSSTLSSISLNTSNVQSEFYVNDTFDYSGLVVTAHYDNGTEDIVTPTSVSSPDMTCTGEKTVTVSYTEGTVTKSADYTINVIEKPITSISATIEKSYHPGDIISIDDIYVENDLGEEVASFEFADDGYQFTYDDAPSGGELGSKIFADAVTFGELTCDVTVNVSRVDYGEAGSVSDILNRELTGVSGTKYTSWSGKTSNSGAFYAGFSAGPESGNTGDTIQLKSKDSNSGIVTTGYSGNSKVVSISVTWKDATDDARVLDIYGKNTAYSSPSDLYGNNKGDKMGSIAKASSTKLDITGSYQFIGIRSNSGALYLSEIVITYGQEETASNVANFIMINDTDGQCETKLDLAIAKLNTMSASEKNTFNTSDDYVIATARTRLNAWAAHEGKTLTLTDDVFTLSANKISLLTSVTEDNHSLTIIMICFVALFSGASAYCFIKKRNDA